MSHETGHVLVFYPAGTRPTPPLNIDARGWTVIDTAAARLVGFQAAPVGPVVVDRDTWLTSNGTSAIGLHALFADPTGTTFTYGSQIIGVAEARVDAQVCMGCGSTAMDEYSAGPGSDICADCADLP